MFFLVADEGREILCLGLGESHLVRQHMVLVGLEVDSEARSFLEPLQYIQW